MWILPKTSLTFCDHSTGIPPLCLSRMHITRCICKKLLCIQFIQEESYEKENLFSFLQLCSRVGIFCWSMGWSSVSLSNGIWIAHQRTQITQRKRVLKTQRCMKHGIMIKVLWLHGTNHDYWRKSSDTEGKEKNRKRVDFVQLFIFWGSAHTSDWRIETRMTFFAGIFAGYSSPRQHHSGLSSHALRYSNLSDLKS